MSVEVYLIPLERFLAGAFAVPVEKYCRGKGVTLFDVAPRPWALVPESARIQADAWWRQATGEPAPRDGADAPHAELCDGEGLSALRALAAAGPGGAAAFPQLLAEPHARQVFFPAPVGDGAGLRLGPDGPAVAAGSAPALAAELEGLAGRVGAVRDWGAVGEGEFAAAHDDPRFALKTAWSILRFVARESERRGLPMVLWHPEDES